MSVAARLTGFAVLIALVAALGFGLGRAVGPVGAVDGRGGGHSPAPHGQEAHS